MKDFQEKTPLNIEAVNKNFGQKRVLKDVSLSVETGQIYGLIGLNGVGKTTLIKIILNLLPADKGEAKFYGADVNIPEGRGNIAYLPEKFQPSPFLKGYEFLSLALSYHGKKLDIEEAKEKAQMLNLSPDMLAHRVSKYSKGMGQKLGLLSVLLADTPLLILDEPMSGLDPSARIKLKNILQELKAKGKTVFFSSHILSDIEEICDKIAIINDGSLIYEGTSESFLSEYEEKNLEMAFLKAIEQF